MTSTINGIGTHLSGGRKITAEELVRWSEHLPIKPYVSHPEFYIATESFVLLFLPLFPIKTFVYYNIENSVWSGDKYIICYHPSGENQIYWGHVKDSYVFYVMPAIITALGFKWSVNNFM